jgi:hypothetical protein
MDTISTTDKGKTMDKKEYNKVYQNCMYLARKELVARHADEYKKILDKVMLDYGIMTRRERQKLTELLRELNEARV